MVEGATHITYGIKCGTEEIHDISVDFDFVSDIAKKLNDHTVSNIHFPDVIEDFLN